MSAIRKQVDRFTEAAIDDEIVLMKVDTGEFYSLARTGAQVWRLVDGARTEKDIVEILSAEFDEEPQVIGREVGDLIRTLADLGLVDPG